MLKKIGILAGILSLTLFITGVGCGQKSSLERQTENKLEKQLGGKADVEIDKGVIKIETKEGSVQVGGNISLPKNFPSDVYVIDGKIMSAMENIGSAGFQVAIEADYSLKDAKSLYESKLRGQGWSVETPFEMATAVMISAKKGSRQLIVTLGTEAGRDELAVVLSLTE